MEFCPVFAPAKPHIGAFDPPFFAAQLSLYQILFFALAHSVTTGTERCKP
jgi:hypothetical protein